jgi:hypothetical protein
MRIFIFIIILLSGVISFSQSTNSYLSDFTNVNCVDGEYRILELDDRKGINPTSIHTRLKIPNHNLNNPKGSLSLWVFSLEELFAFNKRPVMLTKENLNVWTYSFLSDIPNIGDFDNSNFNFAFYTGWHPSLITKFYKGDVFADAIRPPKKAYAMASAFEMEKNKWYQYTLTWDMEKKEINIYANGVLVGTADIHTPTFVRNKTNDTLYAGKPLLCYGELIMYDEVLSGKEVKELFKNKATHIDEELQSHLKHMHVGENPKSFNWKPEDDWSLSYENRMTSENTLDDFYVQGIVDTIEVTEEGVHIKTLPVEYEADATHKQMYLWSKQEFEGDIYIEYEFRTNQKFGLTLLLLQASGTSREDFMKDYPPRTSGTMALVHSSDVRNYHIEYYRQMSAVRNDNSNVAIIKNPFEYPVAYGTYQKGYEVGTWHKIQVLQQSNKLTFAVDGTIICEGIDKEFSNNGSVLTKGHIAFRCMVNTDMHFRNLKVYNKKLPYEEVKP